MSTTRKNGWLPGGCPKDNRVREWRRRRDLTQQGLAVRVGTTHPTIQKLESGKVPLNSEWLERLALALGCREVDLLPRDYLARSTAGIVWAPILPLDALQHYAPEMLVEKTFPPPEMLPVPSAHNQIYITEQVDDSMDREIPVGSRLVISFHEDDLTLESGEMYQVLHHGEVLHRLFCDGDGPPRLESLSISRSYPTIFNVDACIVRGRIVSSLRTHSRRYRSE